MAFAIAAKILASLGLPMLAGAIIRDAFARALALRDRHQYARAIEALRSELLASASKDELINELSKRDLQ